MSAVDPNCPRCHGTGTVNVSYGGDGYGGRCCAQADGEKPCPECEEQVELEIELEIEEDGQ